MIVKNEAHVIGRCLASVRPAIGAWAIVDTGSSDGTQEKIRELLADLPGELIERPWIDFATNRNQALDLARSFGDYALIIDADEILEIDAGANFPARLDGAGYWLRQRIGDGEFEYHSAKLLRHDTPWRWCGVLHEYPTSHPQPHMQLLDGLRVRSFPDGARSQRPQREKFLADVEVLERVLRTEPDNARYQFYLAQSLRDAGENERAVDAYLAAWDSRPTRAEPLCELARYLRGRGRYAAAYVHARAAAELPLPGDLLFVDLAVYRWRARDEQAISAFYIGRPKECAVLSDALLAYPALPASERTRIAANARFGHEAVAKS